MNGMQSTAQRQRHLMGQSPQDRGRILVVEADPAFRERLVRVIGGEPDLKVCGEVGDCKAAAPLVGELNPDLVLVDASLPREEGVRSVKQLRAGNHDTKLLVLSMQHAASYANRMLQAGASGYITLEDLDEVADAIRDVLAGLLYVSEEVSGRPETTLAQHARTTAQTQSEELVSEVSRTPDCLAAV